MLFFFLQSSIFRLLWRNISKTFIRIFYFIFLIEKWEFNGNYFTLIIHAEDDGLAIVIFRPLLLPRVPAPRPPIEVVVHAPHLVVSPPSATIKKKKILIKKKINKQINLKSLSRKIVFHQLQVFILILSSIVIIFLFTGIFYR